MKKMLKLLIFSLGMTSVGLYAQTKNPQWPVYVNPGSMGQIPQYYPSQAGIPMLGPSNLTDNGNFLLYKGQPINGGSNGGGGTPALPLGIPQTDILQVPPIPARTAGWQDLLTTADVPHGHPNWMSFQPITVTQTLVNTTFNEGANGSPVAGTQPATNLPGNSWYIASGSSFVTAPIYVSGGGMTWAGTNGLLEFDIGSYGGIVNFTGVHAGPGLTLMALDDANQQDKLIIVIDTNMTINKVVGGIVNVVATYPVTMTASDNYRFVVSGQSFTSTMNGTTLGTYTLPAGTPLTTNTRWGMFSSGGGTATMQGFSFQGTATITQPIPAVGTACILQANGNCGPVVANQGIAPRSDSTIGPVPEIGYSTNNDGTSSIAWQENVANGQYDVRRPRSGVTWATNPITAWSNTMNQAACDSIQTHLLPLVFLPAGTANVTGLQLPPGISVFGQQGAATGTTTLRQSNGTQTLLGVVGSYTTSCNGVTTTFTGGNSTVKYINFQGGGTASPNDIGMDMETISGGAAWDSFNGFGGPGAKILGVNNYGYDLYASSNLGWYMFSGAYNPSSFADTTYHASLELASQDGQFHDIIEYGWNPDQYVAGQGLYNRWYLCGVLLGGSPSFPFTNSFIQVNPNDLCLGGTGVGGYEVTNNRLDLPWFNSVRLVAGPAPQSATVMNNTLEGSCTSQTLNPTNFPTNPGGVSTDPTCAAIRVEQTYLTSNIGPNQYTSSPGLVPEWPVYDVFFETNISGQQPGTVNEPGHSIGGGVGGDPPDGNQNAAVGRSVWEETKVAFGNTAPTIPMNQYRQVHLKSSTATTWSHASVSYPDTIRYLDIGPNDTVLNTDNIITCYGTIHGDAFRILHAFWFDGTYLREFPCPAQTPALVASSEIVTFSSTPTFSVATRASIITLTAGVSSFTLAAGANGQEKTLTFCQNGTGGFTVVPPANVRGFFTVGTTANKCSSQHFTYFVGQTAWLADSAGVINE
jgi:hypothetical protein